MLFQLFPSAIINISDKTNSVHALHKQSTVGFHKWYGTTVINHEWKGLPTPRYGSS
jgi:hypothetical protein